MADITAFAFKHRHGERELITPFDAPAQQVLKLVLEQDLPVAVVRHVVKHGKEAGEPVYFLVCFADRTVTKCDSKGVPIPAKWRGAPEGATYTHELIFERNPEPQPQPAAAGGGSASPNPLAHVTDVLNENFSEYARQITAHSVAADVYSDAGMHDEAIYLSQTQCELEIRLLNKVSACLKTAVQELKKRGR